MAVLGNKGALAPKALSKAAKLPAAPSRIEFSKLPAGARSSSITKIPMPGRALENAAHSPVKALQEMRQPNFGRKALQQAAKNAAPKGREGGSPLGTILNLPGQAVAQGYANILGTTGVTGAIGKVLGNTAKDAISIGELPFVGGVQVGAAAAESAKKGSLSPFGTLGKGIAEGVAHGAAGELLQGHLSGAAKQAEEHPLFSVAEAAGVGSVAGRATGAGLRAAGTQAEKSGVGGELARAGSTVRPPLALTDEAGLAKQGLVKQRTYSKDSFRKAAQVAQDKRREPIIDAKGKAVTVKDRGRTVPVLKASEREQEKLQANRANFEAGRTQSVEQLERDKTRKEANQIEGRLPKVKPAARLGQELSQLVASGTIRTAATFKGDLAKRITVIKDAVQHPDRFRTKDELQAAKQNLKMLEKAARNQHVLKNAPEIVENGRKYAEALSKGDRRLEGLHVFPKEQLDRAALSEYALAHMGAKHAEINGEPALRDANGKQLTDQAIREHALEAGRHPDTLAYVPHIVGAGRRSSFHVPYRPGSRPVAGPHARTGALYQRGATAVGDELVRDELTKKATVANTAEAVDKFVHESGLRRPDGQHFNAKEGVEAAARLNADGTSQYVPVRAFAAKLPVDSQRQLMEAQAPSQMETAHQALLNDRVVTAGDNSKTRNVVLVPKHQLDTLMKQLTPAGHAEKAAQLLNAPFRMAVLPQLRWLTGNFLEPFAVRLPLSGAGINLPGSAVDFAAATKAVRGMERSADPKMARAAQEIRGMQMGGLFIGRRGSSVRRTYQDFSGDAGRWMYGAHVARNLPVMKQMGDLILSVPHTFFAVNKVMESSFQKVALGKQIRDDLQQITGSWSHSIMLGEKALAEVRKGMVDTATQHRFMEEQQKLLGQYNAFNPTMRKLVQTAFPFLPWTLNSIRFVYWTLPASHTAAFTALLKASQGVQAEWEAEHKDVPPGTLSDAVVRKDKGLVDVGRYTPFGATIPIAHGQLEGLPSTFMPQLSGAQKALEGQDAFGRALQVPKTAANPKGEASAGQKIGAAVNSGAESMIPLVSLLRRLQEGGGTSYANSTIFSPKAKPETSHGMSGIDRTLNPFRPTYVKPKAKGSKVKLGPSLGGSLGSKSLGSSLK